MGNMVKARVMVQGTRALLQHHFGPDAIPLEKGEKTEGRGLPFFADVAGIVAHVRKSRGRNDACKRQHWKVPATFKNKGLSALGHKRVATLV